MLFIIRVAGCARIHRVQDYGCGRELLSYKGKFKVVCVCTLRIIQIADSFGIKIWIGTQVKNVSTCDVAFEFSFFPFVFNK